MHDTVHWPHDACGINSALCKLQTYHCAVLFAYSVSRGKPKCNWGFANFIIHNTFTVFEEFVQPIKTDYVFLFRSIRLFYLKGSLTCCLWLVRPFFYSLYGGSKWRLYVSIETQFFSFIVASHMTVREWTWLTCDHVVITCSIEEEIGDRTKFCVE